MRDVRVVYTIWLRELKVFLRDGRIIGTIGQPLLYLLILGQGIANGMTINRAPGVSYLQFMFPGILGMSVLFTSMFSAVSIIWDREFGFLKEVLVAPVSRRAVALGKVLGGATVAVFQATVMVVVAPFAGIYPSPRMAVEVLLLCFLIGVAMTSLGTAIAARMRLDASVPDDHELSGDAALFPERGDVPPDLGAGLDADAHGARPADLRRGCSAPRRALGGGLAGGERETGGAGALGHADGRVDPGAGGGAAGGGGDRPVQPDGLIG